MAKNRDVVAAQPGPPRVTRSSPRLPQTLPCPIPSALTPLPASAPGQGCTRTEAGLGRVRVRTVPAQPPMSHGVRTEHRDSQGLLHFPQGRADCPAQHKGTHSWRRGSAPSPGTPCPVPAHCSLLLPWETTEGPRCCLSDRDTGDVGPAPCPHPAQPGAQCSSRGCEAGGAKGQESPSGLQQPRLHRPLPSREQRPRERSSVSGSASLKCTY